jgi:flagellar basal-body rod modification protein FlgD
MSTTTGIGTDTASVTTTTAATPTDYSQTTKKSTGSEFGLDKDAFLQILVSQLKNQDPQSPADSSQYVQQMTSYAQLEQLTNISEATQTSNANTTSNTAVSLVGHTVKYLDDDGNEQEGEVKSISFKGANGPTMTIGDTSGISLGVITEVH